MGRNLIRTESWHRKLKLRYGQTIYFNNGREVEQHYVLKTYYGRLDGKLTIHTRSTAGEHHIKTKWGLVNLGSYFSNALVQDETGQRVCQMQFPMYAKLHTARGKAERDQVMEFWEAGKRGCTIIPRYKKVFKNKATPTRNKTVDRIAGEGLRAGDLVFAEMPPGAVHFKQFENRMFRAVPVAGAAAPNPNTHEGCLCCEANKR